MENYKFNSLLDATPINSEDKHNLSAIFWVLSDGRKQDIIDNWGIYLAKILEIHLRGEEEKKMLINAAFQHINHLIDEAYIREQQKLKLDKMKEQEREVEIFAMMKYDQEKRLEMIKNLHEKEQKARTILEDPLTYI